MECSESGKWDREVTEVKEVSHEMEKNNSIERQNEGKRRPGETYSPKEPLASFE